MSRLYEYQGKEALSRVGVAVPEGIIARTPDEARAAAARIGKPVAVKAQVWATGRYHAGGIKFAADPDEAFRAAAEILETTIKGYTARQVLVEEKLDIAAEYYAAVIVDGSVAVKAPVLVFSSEGGTGIEEIAKRRPDSIVTYVIDPLTEMSESDLAAQMRTVLTAADHFDRLVAAVYGLYRFFMEFDCSSAEINPLVATRDGMVYAADCHVTIDDNSVFRHPEFEIDVPRDMDREPTELEQLAWRNIEEQDYRGTGYFAQMITDFKDDEIYVGFHGIGGGGSMLGAAALLARGMKIANYADTSGDPPASKVYRVVKTIFSQPISAYVLAGACLANQEQWYHAFAIVKALREELANRPGFPVVILLAGNKEEESMAIMREGLRDLDIRLELYGRDYIYRSDYIGERAEVLITEYLNEQKAG